MESEGVLHSSRETYVVKNNDNKKEGITLETVLERTPSPNSSSSLANSLTQTVADGVPDSLVEEGIEAECANRLSDVDVVVDDDASTEGEDDAERRGLFFQDGFLSLASRDCVVIPNFLVKFSAKTKKLDLSFNALVNMKGLEAFGDLEELILDNNELADDVNFPNLPKLKTLSMNKNKVVDLDRFVSMCRWKFPQLSFLSLVGNDCCPNLLLAEDEEDIDEYQRYRYIVVYKIPGLKFLDFTPVSDSERTEAAKRGKFLSTVKVDENALDVLLASQAATETESTLRKTRKSKNDDTQQQEYSPLPQETRDQKAEHIGASSSKEAYGKCRYVYYGKQSEGNRFIANETL